MQLAPPGPPPLRGRKACGGRGTAAAALRLGACREGQRGPGAPGKWNKTNWQGRSSTNQLATPPHLVPRRVRGGPASGSCTGHSEIHSSSIQGKQKWGRGKSSADERGIRHT